MVRIALAFAVFVATSASAAPFDTPLDKKVVMLPTDPANAHAKPKRSCFAYPGFVVKEVDLGEKGADELSIAPAKTIAAECPAKIAGETIINSKNWSGYFLGVKGPFIFFNADDGYNGGLGFAVFSAPSGKKLFEDSREGDAFQSLALEGDAVVLRYRRIWLAPCSLVSHAKGCWKTVAATTGLAVSAHPDCSKAYRAEMARTPKFANEVPRLRSVLAYNVETRLSGGKLVSKPLAGPVTCRVEE